MKKKLYILMILVLSLFVCCGKVEAVTMYLDCNYTKECDENTYDLSDGSLLTRWCIPSAHVFVPLTKNDGSLVHYVFVKDNTVARKYYKLDDDYEKRGCWLTDFTNDNCNSSNTYAHGVYNIFTEGVCPSGVVNNKGVFTYDHITGTFFDANVQFIPVGKGGTVTVKSDTDETKYVIYSFKNKDGDEQKIAEGYTDEGKYCFAGSNLKTSIFTWLFDFNSDEASEYLLSRVETLGDSYWKVHTSFESRIIAASTTAVNLDGMNICADMTQSECSSEHDYKVIIDSEDSNGNIKKAVNKWYDSINDELDDLSGIVSVVNNTKFMNTCTDLNNSMRDGKKYNFSEDYTKDKFIDDLKKAYKALEETYGMDNVIIDYSTGKGTSASSSVVSYIYKNLLDIDELVELAEKDDKQYYMNIEYIIEAIKRDVIDALNNYKNDNNLSLDIVDLTENLGEYTELIYTSVLYLEDNSLQFTLNSSQLEEVTGLKENFEELIDEYNLNIYPVFNCESLLGEDLIKKINSYLNIFKIAIPILLIIFGVIDFAKPLFAGDDDAMKKAKKTFIKRLFIAILIFLIPTFVNLLLTLANEVWSFINPSSCGLF